MPGLAEHLGALAAEQPLGGSIHVGHHPVLVVGDEAFHQPFQVVSGLRAQLLDSLLRGDVAREAARVDEAAGVEAHVRGDQHVLDRSVAAAQAGFVVADRIAVAQPPQQVADAGRVDVELGNVAADVFLARVAQQIELCLVGAQDGAVMSDDVQRHRRLVEEVAKVRGAGSVHPLLRHSAATSSVAAAAASSPIERFIIGECADSGASA